MTDKYENYICRVPPAFYEFCITLLGFIEIRTPDSCGRPHFLSVWILWVLVFIVIIVGKACRSNRC